MPEKKSGTDEFSSRVYRGDLDGAFEEAFAQGYQEATVDILHPEFGSVWGLDGECRKEYERGVRDAADSIVAFWHERSRVYIDEDPRHYPWRTICQWSMLSALKTIDPSVTIQESDSAVRRVIERREKRSSIAWLIRDLEDKY